MMDVTAVSDRFTGKERDAETGLDYFGARYYSGAEGRFIGPDPLLNSGRPNNPQSWNRYAYVSNNPLRYTDPKGLYQFAASGCSAGDKECEKNYKKNKDHFNNAISYLTMALNFFVDKESVEHKRLDAALKAYGKKDVGGPTIKFGSIEGSGQGATTPDGGTVIIDPSKFKSENTDK
jgi:RHS repeat-associated protein